MYALTARLPPAPPSLLAATPRLPLAALGGLLVLSIGLTRLGTMPPWTTAVAAMVAGHGALLVTALAWRDAGRPRPWWAAPVVAVPLLAAVALAAVAHPAGCALAVIVPAWLWARASRVAVTPLDIAVGAAIGGALGAHVLLTASLTLGYQVVFDPARAASWLAYDAGVSVPAAECFFRGALFDRAQRRWPAPAATALSASLGVARYLVDPLLPITAEMVAGTVFYTGLLGVANCCLFRRTGSVLPGAVGAVVFFAAYRVVAP
ncbi:MAG TPA: CPBP family glutamic-type intramembrane protease [Candidatus Limnocylindria bacterium]|nr:CPBP family glutamic-type intramembrane protease [Candidatus Limnocylindria bacterium]